MDTIEIIKDAIKYPLSDWRKILILGIIILIGSIISNSWILGVINIVFLSLIVAAGFIIGLLINGYLFRIIKSSLDDAEIPGFNKWINMIIDGIKVFVAFIVYFLPLIILLLFALITGFFLILGSMGLTHAEFLANYFTPAVWPGIFNLIIIFSSIMANELFILTLIYLIVIIPVFLVAIANMAYYKGDFRSAFKFSEILDEISLIGWWNLIKWYILVAIIFLAFYTLESFITYALAILNPLGQIIIGDILLLTLIPYSYIFVARSVALIYKPDEED